MADDDILPTLRKIELELRSAPVQQFFEAQDDVTRARFVAFRQEVAVTLGRMTNADLSRVGTQLDTLGTELRACAGRLRAELAALDDAAGVLDTLGKALGLASRIVQLAV